jgi:hypothetical protein
MKAENGLEWLDIIKDAHHDKSVRILAQEILTLKNRFIKLKLDFLNTTNDEFPYNFTYDYDTDSVMFDD